MTKKPAASRTKSRPKAGTAKRGSVAPKPKPKTKSKAKAVKAAPPKVVSRRTTARKPAAATPTTRTKRAAPRKDAPAAEKTVRTSSFIADALPQRPSAQGEAFENTSGQGKDAVVPAEILGWSWGAFLLNFIWAISHRVWLGLLTFVPGIGFLVAVYLGTKGNELAWRKRRWDSVESFRATQRRWRDAAFIYFAAMMAFFVLMTVLTITLAPDETAPTAVTEGLGGSTITSGSGAVSITTPSSWREESGLVEDADIQASDVSTESYLVVFAEPKTDFPADATITQYTEVTRDGVLASLKGGSQPSAARRLEINGMPAIQSALFGAIGGQQVAYLHTAIETPTRYVQVVSWTLKSSWQQNKGTLSSVAGTFVEVTAAK